MINSPKIPQLISQKTFRYQQGMTMWSMLFVMVVLFITAYVVMQLIPIYSANSTIESALRLSVENKNLTTLTRKAVVRDLNKQLYIDNLTDVLDYKNDLKVGRSNNKFIVEANYEREIPLIGDLFLVVRFNTVVECELNGRCAP